MEILRKLHETIYVGMVVQNVVKYIKKIQMNILKMQKKFMEINTIIQKQYSNQQKIKLLLLVKNMEILNKKRIVIQLA